MQKDVGELRFSTSLFRKSALQHKTKTKWNTQMYTLVISTIVGGLLALYCYKEDDWVSRTFFCFLWSFGGFLFGALIAIFICDLAPKKEVVYGPIPLVSMQTVDGVSGAFILGTGDIQSGAFFRFLVRNKDGSLSPYSVTADTRVRLVEDPQLKEIGYWTSTFLEIDPNSCLYSWAIGNGDHRKLLVHEFRVPTGTIIQKLSVQ